MFRKTSGLFGYLFAGFHAAQCFAFDPNDPADQAILADAIEKAVKPLKDKNNELLSEVREHKRKTKDGPSHEELERVEAERDELKAQLANTTKELKTVKSQAEESTKALQSEQGYTNTLLVDNGLTAALSAAGVTNPTHAKAAAAMLKMGAKIEIKVDGDKRSAVVGDKPLADFVKEWSQGDEGKQFVAAPGNSGGNATGSHGQRQQFNGAGNLGGNREERTKAIAARFPDLPAN